MVDPVEADAVKSSYWRFLPAVAIAAIFALGYAMGWQQYLSLAYLGESREALLDHVGDHYALSLVGFVVFYTIATACSFPAASVLSIMGGFLFGWLVGGLAIIFSATTGASMLFLAARTAGGNFLRSKVGGFAERLAKGFEDDAFTYLLVLRLAPFLPFFVVNIAPALFNVRLRTYVAATAIGILPGALAYATLGQGLDSVIAAADAAGRDASVSDLVTPEITLAFAGLALVAVIAIVVKALWSRRAKIH